MEITVNLSREKETQNTFRFRGLKEFGLEGYSIYLTKKDVVELGDPDVITLVITPLQSTVVSDE